MIDYLKFTEKPRCINCNNTFISDEIWKKLYSKVSFNLFKKINDQLNIDFKGYDFLDHIYYGENEFCVNNSEFTGYFDFTITSNIKLCIEFYGNDIHANPKKFKNNDNVMSRWYDNLKASDVWKRDKFKNNIISKLGYNVIIVWEDENIFEDIYSQVLSHIYNTLGYTLEEFEVEDLGIIEEWVYDIEVEDNHNFFANNILVHNSAYIMYNLPFNKFDDINQLVNYIQGLARELGKLYNESLEYYGAFANLDPKYNTMDFKSEVVAYRGFFGGKKFYSLAKCWDEGTFFNEKPKVKETGGQIVKADATPLTLAMLKEIYHVLVEEFNLTDLKLIYQKIFITIKNKYLFTIKKELNAFNIDQFSTPKKWGNTKKSIPTHVHGARLYNAIIRDTFRPSDSFIMIKIVIDVHRLLEFLKGISNNNEFAMSYEEAAVLKAKINVISVPINMSDEEKSLFGQRLKELSIHLDFQEIIDFNINMKLDPYVKLFPANIKNMFD